MAQIFRFPVHKSYAPMDIARGRRHAVSVRVIDGDRPEEARWQLQFAMQRAASFRCLGGFTDAAARRREWHYFTVSSKKTRKSHWLINRFLDDVQPLIAERRVVVEVDGVRARIAA